MGLGMGLPYWGIKDDIQTEMLYLPRISYVVQVASCNPEKLLLIEILVTYWQGLLLNEDIDGIANFP